MSKLIAMAGVGRRRGVGMRRGVGVRADIVVKGNGLEVGDVWAREEGEYLLSAREWRKLLLFYSTEVVRGRCCDYTIERGGNGNWVHFVLLGDVHGCAMFSIGKHRVGRRYDYFLYESRRVVKEGLSVDEMIGCYYARVGKACGV